MTHMFGVVEGCSSNDAEVRAARAESMAAPGRGRRVFRPVLRNRALPDPTPIETRAEFLDRQLAVTGMAAAAGVGILAGTDTPNPFVYPGFSLHDELELLVQAGLTPREALAAATTAPTEFLGATDSLGAVAEGKLADLVLLEANPLEEIGNTRRISLVVANGRFINREEIGALLETARQERASGQP